ncbi:hypothetical protein [Sporosarcina sp. P33]|uniref:hypothetical protein n=1 Tax=Sporosarcina sp. P33 TaxID=1930764 RepID=UPI0009C015C6|nr:hypothetical protein [Sporosarcina sp. P33]ARD47549.1 hypothetical protein SporoP33_04395 [Sporosarcina sp. P33]
MNNNRKNAVAQIMEFIESNDEKVILLKGTHQYEKHSLVLKLLSESKEFNTGLYRSNSMQNIAMQLDHAGYKVKLNQKFTSGRLYNLKGLRIYFDSLFTRSTWSNTAQQLDFAIIYPMDSFCSSKNDLKEDFLNDILVMKNIKKKFIVTWTDIRHDYTWLAPYVDRTVVFDAEEEDPEYHNRVIRNSQRNY